MTNGHLNYTGFYTSLTDAIASVAALADPGTIVLDVAAAITNPDGTPKDPFISFTATPDYSNQLTVSGVAGGTITAGMTLQGGCFGASDAFHVLVVAGSVITASGTCPTGGPQGYYALLSYQDATHPNTHGGQLMASVALATMQAAWDMSAVGVYLPPSSTALDNLFVNAGLEQGSSGGLGTGWSNYANVFSSAQLSVVADAAYASGLAQQVTLSPGQSGSYGVLGPNSVNVRALRGRKIRVIAPYSANGFIAAGAHYAISASFDATPAAPNPALLYGGQAQQLQPINMSSADFEGSHLIALGETVVPMTASYLSLGFSYTYNANGQGNGVPGAAPGPAVIRIGDLSAVDADDPWKPFSATGAIDVVSVNTNLDNTYETVLCSSAATALTITLPGAAVAPVVSSPTTAQGNALAFANLAGNAGKVFRVIKVDASANACTLATTGSDTITGAATRALASQGSSVTLVGTGATAIEGGCLGSTGRRNGHVGQPQILV